MFNYMNCTNMMFGSQVKYCVTYKLNEKSFDIHRKKYEHGFKTIVLDKNLDGSKGLSLETENMFMVSDRKVINFYHSGSYQEIEEQAIEIPLLKSKTREQAEILSMQLSHDDQFLAVVSGRNMIMDEQFPN